MGLGGLVSAEGEEGIEVGDVMMRSLLFLSCGLKVGWGGGRQESLPDSWDTWFVLGIDCLLRTGCKGGSLFDIFCCCHDTLTLDTLPNLSFGDPLFLALSLS